MDDGSVRPQTYAKAEKHRKAEKDFAKAVSGVTKPGDIANTHLHRSRSLEQLDDFKEAIGALSKAIEAVESTKFKPFPEPGWYATRAGYHRKVGDFENAAKDYTRVRSIPARSCFTASVPGRRQSDADSAAVLPLLCAISAWRSARSRRQR
jgi:tetratricopeptide (TPR) repeat protein